jgi:peroxiredoxin
MYDKYNVSCHLNFSKHKKLRFPLLSDFQPNGNFTKIKVFIANMMALQKDLFVVSKDGIIRYNYVSPIGVNPGGRWNFQGFRSSSPKSNTIGGK